MVELITNIDCALCSCTPGINHGLCRLLLDDKGVPYPSRYSDNGKVTPDDRFSVMWYHRLLDGSVEDSELLSFGRTFSRVNNQRVRLVIASDIKLGDGIVDAFIFTLPERMNLEAYRYAHIGSSVNLIRDRQSIWETEWGNAYKDKYQLRYNLYAVEYSIEYVKCEDCVCA